MTKLMVAACGTCAIASIAVTAQTPQLERSSPRTGTVTVTGCLREWRAPVEAQSGDLAGEGEARIQFILSKVKGEEPIPVNRRYALVPGASVKLDTLVNRHVEVTGIVAVASRRRSAWTTAEAPAAPSGKIGEAFTLIPTLRAQRVRLLSGPCP